MSTIDMQNDKIKALYEKGVLIQQYIDDDDDDGSNYNDDNNCSDDNCNHHHHHSHTDDDYDDEDEEQDDCPLCMEEFDATDKQFRPCKCGYQICIWCWHRIMETAEGKGRCPNCRRFYDQKNFEFKKPDQKLIERDVSKQSKRSKRIPSRRQLANMRVIQRNLVYAVGLTLNVAREEFLRRDDSFGAYGRIAKIVINKNNLYNRPSHQNTEDDCDEYGNPRPQTVSAYITFVRSDDARKAIQAIDGTWLDGRQVRASFGTTKYCAFFLRGVACNNPDCMYLHDYANEEDTFNKEDIVLKNGVPVPQNMDKLQHLYPQASGDVAKHEWAPNVDSSQDNNVSGSVVIATNVIANPTKKAGLPSSAKWGKASEDFPTVSPSSSPLEDSHISDVKNASADNNVWDQTDLMWTKSNSQSESSGSEKETTKSSKLSSNAASSSSSSKRSKKADKKSKSTTNAAKPSKRQQSNTIPSDHADMEKSNSDNVETNSSSVKDSPVAEDKQSWQTQPDLSNSNSILSSLLKLNVTDKGTTNNGSGFASKHDPILYSPTRPRSRFFDDHSPLSASPLPPQSPQEQQMSKFGVPLEQSSSLSASDLQQSLRALLPNVNINFSKQHSDAMLNTNVSGVNRNDFNQGAFAMGNNGMPIPMHLGFASPNISSPSTMGNNVFGMGPTSGMWNTSTGLNSQNMGAYGQPQTFHQQQHHQTQHQQQPLAQHQFPQSIPQSSTWNNSNININNNINININPSNSIGYGSPHPSWDNVGKQSGEKGSSILEMLKSAWPQPPPPHPQQQQQQHKSN